MSSKTDKIRIVCISDTHNAHSSISLPRGDVLIHAGDLTNQGSYHEIRKALEWVVQAEFAVKIVVAGNHDLSLDPNYTVKHEQGWGVTPVEGDVAACRELVDSLVAAKEIVYLEHSAAVIHVPVAGKAVALRVFGSPQSPDRGKQNWAFQYPEKLAEPIWSAMPTEVDILITHTPPKGFCDASRHWVEGGCSSLVTALSRVRPLLHVCGHCHEGRGAVVVRWEDINNNNTGSVHRTWQDPGAGNKKQSLLDLTGKTNGERVQRGRQTAIVNATIMAHSDRRGKSFHKPIVINLPLSG